MDANQKGLTFESKDMQMPPRWFPVTPAKLGSTRPQPICTESNNQLYHDQWLQSADLTQANERGVAGEGGIGPTSLPERFLQGNRAACDDLTNAPNFSTWVDVAVKSLTDGDDDISRNDEDVWRNNVSFAELLALVDAAGTTAAAENGSPTAAFNATSSTFSLNFHPETGSSQFATSENCSSMNGRTTHGANFPVEHNSESYVLKDGSCGLSKLSFDLNFPSKTAYATSSEAFSSQIEPITPEKTTRVDDRPRYITPSFSMDETPRKKRVELEGSYQNKESLLVVDQLNESTSRQLEENHKPDKGGGTEDIDLSKTPQQKPRRKKHRPKVIIEGQSQVAPKRRVGRPSHPQETKTKRKYVRRKGVDNPTISTSLERETTGTDTTTNPPGSKETTPIKRKYVRKKGVKKPAASIMDEGNCEKTDPEALHHASNSCRRSLIFDFEGPDRDESLLHHLSPNVDRESQAQNFNAKDGFGSFMQYGQGREATMKKTEGSISNGITHSMKQATENYTSIPEGQSFTRSPHTMTDTLDNKYTLLDKNLQTRGKCQIVVSDSTHDKEGSAEQVIDHTAKSKSPSDSYSSSNACLTHERQERGQKRQNIGTSSEEFCNSIGIFHNSLQSFHDIFSKNVCQDCHIQGMCFPSIYKTKRIQKEHISERSSMHPSAIASENCFITAADGKQNRHQTFKLQLSLGPTARLKNGISQAPVRVCHFASSPEICGRLQASPSTRATPSKALEGLVLQRQKKRPKSATQDPKAPSADSYAAMVGKKRPKKYLLLNSTVPSTHSNHQLTSRSTGPPLAITWRSMSPVEVMIEQFKQLDLNAKSSQDIAQMHDPFASYHMNYQEQRALIPYGRDGALVPFDHSFDPVKRSRPRPKVDLDDETTKVWKLLLENINSEGIDGTDEEKAKWWEEERRVFQGRADSFIARMHLVQGDRRFSPWKGSVLDSVVGVFLTQNVSDHLSSSAYMSLAARFPIQSKSNPAKSSQEKVSITISEPEMCDHGTDDTFGWNKVSNKPSSSRQSKMLHDYNNIIETAYSVKSSGNSYEDTMQNDFLRGQLSGFSRNSLDTSSESAVNKSIDLVEEERDSDDTPSQNSVVYSQNSADSVIAQTPERNESPSLRTLEVEPAVGSNPNSICCSTSYTKPSQMHGVHNQENKNKFFNTDRQTKLQSMTPESENQNENQIDITGPEPDLPSSEPKEAGYFDLHQENNTNPDTTNVKELCDTELSGLSAESTTQPTSQFLTISSKVPKFHTERTHSSNNHPIDVYQRISEKPDGSLETQFQFQGNNYKMQEISNFRMVPQTVSDITGSSNIGNSRKSEQKEVGSNLEDPGETLSQPKGKGGKVRKEKQNPVDWDSLRKSAQESGRRREKTANTMDSVDWEAVRCADVNEIAQTIKERGMNNVLAARIQEFLNRLVRDHGSIDLEWLRDIPPDKAKEYLLSIRGLGLKSVECVRLLTLHHLAFPVDTNVGRIAVRLGWVPLQPLPESLQLHLLELYPVLESIQKYLWPRLCKLDQRTLYELHYQLITFGKVFCTKSKPNCNACPMRGECRHFASAFASARLALPGPEEKRTLSAIENNTDDQNTMKIINPLLLPLCQDNRVESKTDICNPEPIIEVPATPEPIVEVPATPEPEQTPVPEYDIEDSFEDPDDIPTIQLNMEEFTHNLQAIMQKQTEVQEGDMSKALVALTQEAASIPMPKLKNVSRLRTEHQVYELPDSHPLLSKMDKREPDDPSSYLLAIWTPGETADSIQPPEIQCSSHESGTLCNSETCLSCSSIREGNSETVRGTLLIPCRTAMRGSFPLNGTYFQVNEVFADHESSLNPINVRRDWLWNLPRRTVYFGTSIPTIFKGLSTEGIQYCFWRGFVCVRGFDWETRAPRPLVARLHFPASKVSKVK